jgi:hypothetical protein
MANVDPNILLRKGNIFFAEKTFFQKFSEIDIIKMLKFLIKNIYDTDTH